MSIAGVSYGHNDQDCEDAFEKKVTNFNMVDSDLNTLIQSVNNGSNSSYEHIQRFLYHLALCHTAMTVSLKEGHSDSSLCCPSPDEVALINAA